jgi:hypothetical protein
MYQPSEPEAEVRSRPQRRVVLPLIDGGTPANGGTDLTAEQLAQILIDDEAAPYVRPEQEEKA